MLLLLTLSLIGYGKAQKLLVILVEGLGGSNYHKYSHLPGFKTFEEEGVWSTRLFPVFPTLPLPNRHSLFTGVLPRKHGLIGDFIYNSRNNDTFNNFTAPSDFDKTTWWGYEPLYITATKAKASVAMFFFPECEVAWDPAPQHCVSTRSGLSFADETAAKAIVEATKTHDIVLVQHSLIREQVQNLGPRRMTNQSATEVHRIQQSLERVTSQARERLDLNVIVVSPHGYTDLPRRNVRVLDDYIPMELINTTVCSGALKQIIAKNGKTHQGLGRPNVFHGCERQFVPQRCTAVYSQLRHHNQIPNVKMYYTTPRIGDMPEWYHYKRSSTIADLVLIAQPGYSITTREESKQFPIPGENDFRRGMSGYNNQFPDMLGLFLAYGPLFRKGMHKGSLELCDIYALMCRIMRLDCNPSPGRYIRVKDVLTSDARVIYHRSSNSSKYSSFCCITTFIFITTKIMLSYI